MQVRLSLPRVEIYPGSQQQCLLRDFKGDGQRFIAEREKLGTDRDRKRYIQLLGCEGTSNSRMQDICKASMNPKTIQTPKTPYRNIIGRPVGLNILRATFFDRETQLKSWSCRSYSSFKQFQHLDKSVILGLNL